MPDYKEMYNRLCHAQAKLDYLFAEAQAIISEVQQETERMYVESKDPVAFSMPQKHPSDGAESS